MPRCGRFAPNGGRFTHIWDKTTIFVKLIMSFYFYDIIYFTKKISVYQEFDELLFID